MIELTDKEEVVVNEAPKPKKATLEELRSFFQRMSGKNEFGDGKASISYQTYAFDDDDNSKDKETIYQISKAMCNLSYDQKNPQFVSFEIAFNSYDDTELKLLWGRLQRHLKNEQAHPEKIWIFYFQLMERSSISSNLGDNDTLYIGHLFNPVMFFLSRETPTTLAEDFVSNGELVGGNVIKMLIPLELFQFEVSDDYDTVQWKGEARREDDARDYVDNYKPQVWED